jgi:2-polyprenyl-3-methyl-5-hydroxy-6-metoxy-1,4-benzoquinol methylase
MKCPLCLSSNSQELSYGGHIYFSRSMPLLLCRDCGLKYIAQQLSPQEITSMYDNPDYFDADYAGGAQSHYTENQKLNEMRARRVLQIVKKLKPHGKLLEIGCAGGHFLDFAKKQGYAPTGVEMSSQMAAHARSLGLTVYTGEVYNLPENEGPFDIIYMGDVLEHVPNLNDYTQYILSRLNPGGLLVLELPLTYNITLVGLIIGLKNLITSGRWDFRNLLPAQHRPKLIQSPPYHLLLFNRKSIKKLMEIHHLKSQTIRIYDGAPKPQYRRTAYGMVKTLTHFLTEYLFPFYFGDRGLVVAQKK